MKCRRRAASIRHRLVRLLTAAPWDDNDCSDEIQELVETIPLKVRTRLRIADSKPIAGGIEGAVLKCTSPNLLVKVTLNHKSHRFSKKSAKNPALWQYTVYQEPKTYRYNVKDAVTLYFSYVEKLEKLPDKIIHVWHAFDEEAGLADAMDVAYAKNRSNMPAVFDKCVAKYELMQPNVSKSKPFLKLIDLFRSLVAAGYWHCDLWPEAENVMMNSKGELKFIDIGSIGEIA